jgi:phosphomannomutase / phosphoglucomutase
MPCDIRGEAATELSPALYEAWGRALGGQLSPSAKFVVGGDVRESTPPFLAALIDGLCQAGLNVVDLGLLPTPMIYYAKRRLHANGCAIVTASHNPAAVNGLKWMLGERPPTPDDVAALERAAEALARPGWGDSCAASLTNGTGSSTAKRKNHVRKGRGEGNGDGRSRTEPRTLDISFDYVACLQEMFVDSLTAQRRIVLDPMFGCWAGRARRYLHAIFPQCLFSTIHDEVDDRFDGRTPDCSRPDELNELCDEVYRERAHLGLAFDGDGDRVALVDNEGVALRAEEAACVLLRCLGKDLDGERFVYDLKFSDRVPEVAKQFGAEPLVERSGHAFLRTRMRDSAALFGAEASGHYFYRALESCDDGLYTACLVIAYLARSDQTLAELRRACPPVYMTPDLRLSIDPDVQPKIIEQIRMAWDGFPQRTIDGVRIDTPCGWALVRSSVTEPALTFRFEGLDWHALDDLVERFCDSMPQYGGELWEHFRAAMGSEEE